jgi:hypothetical protein
MDTHIVKIRLDLENEVVTISCSTDYSLNGTFYTLNDFINWKLSLKSYVHCIGSVEREPNDVYIAESEVTV